METKLYDVNREFLRTLPKIKSVFSKKERMKIPILVVSQVGALLCNISNEEYYQ